MSDYKKKIIKEIQQTYKAIRAKLNHHFETLSAHLKIGKHYEKPDTSQLQTSSNDPYHYSKILFLIKSYFKSLDPQVKKNLKNGLIIFLVISLLYSMFVKTIDSNIKSFCQIVLEKDDSGIRNDRKARVEVMPVKSGIMTKRVTAVGRAKASEHVVIKSELNGRIKEILFKEGGSVEKNQEIIRFEDEELKAELQAAKARLTTAQANYDRTSKLHAQKFGSLKEFDRDKGELEQATAQVELLSARLSKTVIKAPFNGQIGLIEYQVGSFVPANTDLVTVTQSKPMKIDFKIPEKFVGDIGVGQAVELRIDAYKDKIFNGYVEAVDVKVDPESNSIALKALTENTEGHIVPGSFVNVSLIIGERSDALMVDENAIAREGNIEYVWAAEKGKAHRKRIRTGVREKHMVEITEGLIKGELVIVEGQQRLMGDGQQIKIVNDKDLNSLSEADNKTNAK